MSYKLGIMLSMVFVILFSLFAIDMLVIQNTYTLLDSKSINISYFLARNGDVSDDAINYIERTYNVEFTLVSSPNPAFGDDIIYNLSTVYHPYVMGEDMNIVIQRMAVVGYFN